MSDEPLPSQTVSYLVCKRDDPANIFTVTLNYDDPQDEEAVPRIFQRYMEDNNLKLAEVDALHRPWSGSGEKWADTVNRLREERNQERDAIRGVRREMGVDYDVSEFEDFNLGPDLEKVLDDDATDDLSHYDERAEAVYALLRDCFDKMRTEGEWQYNCCDENSDGFAWRPDLWAEFWGDEFPFTLDFRPADILPAVLGELHDRATDTGDGEPGWDEDIAESFEDIENDLKRWRDAFAEAIVALRTRAEELKAKQT